ncbi:hypothetical protein TNCV_3795611 [Trichonephila clavipes]|nr:hypothetical protein TNCV_3795611 [Trichonephila clavipes]
MMEAERSARQDVVDRPVVEQTVSLYNTHAYSQLIASLVAVQTPIARSLRVSMTSRTIAMCLPEGHLISRRSLRVLSITPPTDTSV